MDEFSYQVCVLSSQPPITEQLEENDNIYTITKMGCASSQIVSKNEDFWNTNWDVWSLFPAWLKIKQTQLLSGANNGMEMALMVLDNTGGVKPFSQNEI